MKPKSSLIFILIFCLLGIWEPVFGQKFILLQRGSNQKSRLKYEIGEELIYKKKGTDYFIYERIKDITPEVIVLTENLLLPGDIDEVFILNKDPRNSTIGNLAYLGMGGGLIFLVGSTVNSLYQNGDLSEVSNSLGWPVGLFATGFALSKMKYKKFRNQGKNKVQLVILYGE